MQGDKIEQARTAAIHAIDRLRDSDIVSVIAYDSSVTVVVPATRRRIEKQSNPRSAKFVLAATPRCLRV